MLAGLHKFGRWTAMAVLGWIFLATAAALVGCWTIGEPVEIHTASYGDPNAAHRVLLAAEGTPFNQSVVDKLYRRTMGTDSHVRVIPVRDLMHVTQREWNAIVVLAGVRALDVHPAVRRCVETADDPDGVLVVLTSDDPGYTYPYHPDAVVVAPEMAKTEQLAHRIETWIRGRLDLYSH